MKNGSDQNQSQTLTQQSAAKPRGNRRLLWILLFLLVGSAAVSFVVFRYVLPSVYGVPLELVGTWQVAEGNFKGATFECRWNGTAVFTVHKGGKKESDQYAVRVRGNRILLTAKDPTTGDEQTLMQTILKLTDDELVFRDQDEVTYHLIRIRD